MGKLKVISSNSSGNSYILQCGEESLILELGIPLKEITKTLSYNLSHINACIVTHIHADHAKYIPQAQSYGLPVYSCQEVADKYKNVTVLHLGEKVRIGGFAVQPIDVPHSCECYAYLIEHKEIGRLLFCTDCTLFKYKIRDLNHILIESNYSEEYLIDNMCEDVDIVSHFENHMELEDTIRAIKNNFSANLQNICLLHLSNTNSEPIYFKRRVQEEIGLNCIYIAEKGLEIELNNSEF